MAAKQGPNRAANLRESMRAMTTTALPSPLVGKPGQRQMPGALVLERRLLEPDPEQPRKVFDEAKLEELAESFKRVGILQPLRVRPAAEEGRFIIVNGERRWRAAALADLPEIPVVVRDSDADQRAFEMLIENLQREDLTDDEEARAYQGLIGQGYNQRAIAERLGVSEARISRNLRLYSREPLAVAVANGMIGKGEAQEFLRLTVPLQERAVEHLARRRAAGERVTTMVARAVARDAEALLDAGHSEEDVMESLAARKTFHNEKADGGANPRRTIDVAARHFVDRGHALIGAYPTMAMSAPVAEALDAMLAALAEWRARNPPAAG
jgi:ParB family chromosome partitioning protein